MSTSTNTKLCPFCDGQIHVQCFQCLHCGSELDPENENFASQPLTAQEQNNEQFIPKAPYSLQEEPMITDEEWNEDQKLENTSSQLPLLASFTCLSIAASFFLFCICLLFFAKNGIFSLHWKASYWPVYFIASLCSLFYGLKFLNQIDSVQEEG